MKNVNISRHLGAVSALALTAAAAIASVQPAAAEVIRGGGASLVSLVIRDLGDCYNGFQPSGAASTRAACTAPGYANSNSILYASVGSGAGRRAFLSNDSRQLLPGSNPLSNSQLPSILPQYLGYGVTDYPYERGGNLSLDFGSSEAPHSAPVPPFTTPAVTPWIGFTPASNWELLAPPPAVAITGLSNGAATTYNAAKLGRLIQVPFAEVGDAIAVNAPRTNKAPWQIAYRGNTVMHLTQPQLCAIFAGAVTDWNDATTDIAYRDSTNTLNSYKFMAPNGGNPYTTASLPIRVVYRSDGSGTTFIMLNYLNAVCPYFDDGANRYTQIFAAPTDRFTDLITRINTQFPARAANTATWIGATGNVGVADNIRNEGTPALSGRIGYVSADFAKPYYTIATAPWAAGVQNEQQRQAGIEVPSAAAPFNRPTPVSLAKAWVGMPVPNTTVDYQGFNVYNVTQLVHPKSELPSHLGDLKSRLATPTAVGSYPINGTGFLSFYSCYKDPTGARVTAITDFMSWLYGGQTSATLYPAGTPATSTRNAPRFDANVKTILNAAGFNPLPASYANRILTRFVSGASLQGIASLSTPRVNGCRSVNGGAE